MIYMFLSFIYKNIALFNILMLIILCTINLAIVLYGLAHPHQISSFICSHEDTSADHLTRFLKNTELPNAAAVLK